MTNTFTIVDRAALLGIGEYAPLVAFRQELRGGDGPGEDIQGGLVPQRSGEFEEYGTHGFRLPALWVSNNAVSPDETEAVQYSIELTLILPSLVGGAKITGDQIQEAADLVLQAGQFMDNINRTSIAGRLQAAGKSQCSRYVFERLAYEGGFTQPRIVAGIRFLVPYQALTGKFIGVRNA